MVALTSVLLALAIYYLLYKVLFDDWEDIAYQIKSFLAWLPVTILLEYDFSDSTWRVWVWLPSGFVVGIWFYALVR